MRSRDPAGRDMGRAAPLGTFYSNWRGRQELGEIGVKHLDEFFSRNIVCWLARAFVAMVLAWRRGLVRKDPGWKARGWLPRVRSSFSASFRCEPESASLGSARAELGRNHI